MTVSLETAARVRRWPFRKTFAGTQTFLAVAGLAGAWQLWDGTYAPPLSNIDPLGLDSWRLPAVWLFSSVAVPAAVAAIAAYRRWDRTPGAVLVASGLLLFEVTVQIPFVGPSILQVVFGAVAITMGSLAVIALRSGRWHATGDESDPTR